MPNGQTSRPLNNLEHEFIRGNRDGPTGTNDTYTVCRLRVAQEDLDREMTRGFHSRFLTLPACWDCPGHIYLSAWIGYLGVKLAQLAGAHRIPQPSAAASVDTWIHYIKGVLLASSNLGKTQLPSDDADLNAWIQCVNKVLAKPPKAKPVRLPPRVAPLAKWCDSGMTNRPAEVVEIVQRDPDRPHGEGTFSICRIGVPRESMVQEVREGLHPGYHVGKAPRGHEFVQGNPTSAFDNVNEPESLGAEPGFSRSQLCPMRLLRSGALDACP